jgi:hypothetical protein
MKDMGIIQGSAAQAVPLIVGKDRVDVHTDITPVTQDNEGNPVEGSFQYHEIQYEKDEYIRIMAEKNSTLEVQLTDTQLALVEIYESLGV